jgi:UDP-galactopyranose mutase
MDSRYLVVGCGFSGAVLANHLVSQLDCSIEIWDERDHIAGNCYTRRDEQTNVMVHEYGPHIFNTDRKEIWDYVNSFVPFIPYVHRVKAKVGNTVYGLPLNLYTLNQFFQATFSPADAAFFLDRLADKTITDPQNFEEQALRFMGIDLYRAFFYGYTKKQWGCEPRELPASVLKRIPIRFDYNDNYHNSTFTGIPVDGYTAVVQKMIDHPAITVHLKKSFVPGMDLSQFDHVFYTGPIDKYFHHQFGRLGYRTVTFEKEYAGADFQGTAQMNFCDLEVPYTRITEHKHFAPWEKHDQTVYFREYSKETTPSDQPYYPKCQKADKQVLKLYRAEAGKLNKVSFLGRLATYRYMDMHHVIGEAIDFGKKFVEHLKTGQSPPVFSNIEPD